MFESTKQVFFGEDIFAPFTLGTAIVGEFDTRHSWAIAMFAAMLAANIRVDYPVAEFLFPEFGFGNYGHKCILKQLHHVS